MNLFVESDDWNNRYETVLEYVGENTPAEGSRFKLIQATVVAETTYQIVDGKPIIVEIAVGAQLE